MHVIKPFYLKFERINNIPLQIGLDYSTTKLLKIYLEFDHEISRHIKKENGIIQSTGKRKYYLYYNHDNILELSFKHCLLTEWGYFILMEPIFTSQEISCTSYFIYYGGDIPRSEIGIVK